MTSKRDSQNKTLSNKSRIEYNAPVIKGKFSQLDRKRRVSVLSNRNDSIDRCKENSTRKQTEYHVICNRLVNKDLL